MAEIMQHDGTWTFDGTTLRIVPGNDKGVGLLRKELGELTVPLEALAGISFANGRKEGRLKLRMRAGADPLSQATGGKLDDDNDPYQLKVRSDRFGVAEYFVDEVRTALELEQVPGEGCDRYLLPGPPLPVTASAGDGAASFDGEQVRLEWNWKTPEAKSTAGTRLIPLAELSAVEWQPAAGMENGYLRFTVRHAPSKTPPKHDPNAVELWGFRRDPLMALVAAAVQAKLPHPAAPAGSALPRGADPRAGLGVPADSTEGRPSRPTTGEGAADDHDVLLRRLRELGELHRDGILTEEEFTAAKQAVLKRM